MAKVKALYLCKTSTTNKETEPIFVKILGSGCKL